MGLIGGFPKTVMGRMPRYRVCEPEIWTAAMCIGVGQGIAMVVESVGCPAAAGRQPRPENANLWVVAEIRAHATDAAARWSR